MARANPHDFLVHQALKRLNAMVGVTAWQNMSLGDVRVVGRRPGQYFMIPPGVERGVADILAIACGGSGDQKLFGVHCEFEAKTTKRTANSRLSKDQREHRDRVREYGGIYLAFSEPDEPAAYLRQWIAGGSTA